MAFRTNEKSASPTTSTTLPPPNRILERLTDLHHPIDWMGLIDLLDLVDGSDPIDVICLIDEIDETD